MQIAKRFSPLWMFAAVLLALFAYFSIPPTAKAQTAGEKAVYKSDSTCCAFSSAFVDAYAVSTTLASPDFCGVLKYILTPSNHILPSTGGVIDARGLTSSNVSMSCSSTETPWLKNGTNSTVPSTIFLPAGKIVIGSTWIMPDATRIVGRGTGTGDTTATVLEAAPSFAGPMIEMGHNGLPAGYSANPCPATGSICHGISVEDLTLDGDGQIIDGILNTSSQEISYVNHVRLYQIRGTGLNLRTNARNSGPYSNITFDTGGYVPTSSTACAQIVGLTGTRGLHGLTCISSTISPVAAVYLDSSNNSIKDVIIEGFTDGVRVGSQAAARSNVLFNILGDTTQITQTQAPAPINVIHVTPGQVSDLVIMGIRNTGGGSRTIQDDLTTTTLIDPSIAIYSLGKIGLGGSGYSRFTTSPNAATWGVGSGSPLGSSCTAQDLGSLYSNTGGTAGLWVCETSNTWNKVF